MEIAQQEREIKMKMVKMKMTKLSDLQYDFNRIVDHKDERVIL
jgi:hypothetical protein